MKSVTFDTTSKPSDAVVKLASEKGWKVTYASITHVEAKGASFEVELKEFEKLSVLGVWGSPWSSRWSTQDSSKKLDEILKIISNGSFPVSHENLSEGQVHQLRDALIFEAHLNSGHTAFVTGDAKAFINNNKRTKFKEMYNSNIYSPSEFVIELNNEQNL